jgi:hypothetical protein
MGVQVAVTLDTQQKPNYVVSTVLAASFAPANGELVLWIGNAHTGSKHEEVSAIKRCLEYIRENGSTTPDTIATNESYAKVAAPFLKSGVTGAFDAVAALPAETDIGIWYGSLFQPLNGSTITPHALRALEKYLETTQKAA